MVTELTTLLEYFPRFINQLLHANGVIQNKERKPKG